jgi:drug/metabolite transporter (DMT)-like permease/DNA-binding NarL/FixJ family response regulator
LNNFPEAEAAQKTATRHHKILIVDDYRTNRLKMSAAVGVFGYETVEAADGVAALETLAHGEIDLVLLDIVMPGMSGFEVLQAMKADTRLRDIPVIIISALESQMQSVVNAIENGAEDFLPKDFEPALLKARLSACLEKKRLRDREKQYLAQVAKLTKAARVLENGKYNPSKLGIADVAARSDGLGALAKVFSTMAQEVYVRERRLRQNIRTAQGGLLLLVCGMAWGVGVPLSKMAANIADHPVGLSLLVNFLAALICLPIALARGALPDPRKLTAKEWSYIIVLAVFASKIVLYFMTSKLPATTVSIVIVLEGFAVFLFSAILGIEKPNAKRLLGLAMGLFGVLVVVWLGEDGGGSAQWIWILVALIIPSIYATEDIYISQKRPAQLDIVGTYVYTSLLSCLIHVPLTLAFNDFIPLDLLWGQFGFLAVLIAASTALSMICYVHLISSTGAVFAAQAAYIVTIAGLLWSMLLLGERLQPIVWFALALIIVGLLLVEPKHEAEEEPPLPADPEEVP